MESHLLFGRPHYFQVLNPNAARGKGGLPSVVTHLNAKDAFLPSSLSFFTLISLTSSISPTLFFSFYYLIISSLSLSFHLQSNFCPASPPLFSSRSRSCISSSCTQIPNISWKVKITSATFSRHVCLLPYTIRRDLK